MQISWFISLGRYSPMELTSSNSPRVSLLFIFCCNLSISRSKLRISTSIAFITQAERYVRLNSLWPKCWMSSWLQLSLEDPCFDIILWDLWHLFASGLCVNRHTSCVNYAASKFCVKYTYYFCVNYSLRNLRTFISYFDFNISVNGRLNLIF